MAVDETNKTLNICSTVMTASADLMEALHVLLDTEDDRAKAGLTLSTYDTAITNATAATKHAAGADYQAALTSAGALKTWMDTNFHTTNFAKVKPK
jgi:hypothetical protein